MNGFYWGFATAGLAAMVLTMIGNSGMRAALRAIFRRPLGELTLIVKAGTTLESQQGARPATAEEVIPIDELIIKVDADRSGPPEPSPATRSRRYAGGPE
ncbi:hypothetical protein AB0L65_48590 [Nonomuraea sp. NPDC052116]|uniref:hypothetical protein n=1 Tax=Nonomuraea sp. NPDC052116 TaxID=3155665 RepID=UPI003425B0FD